MTSSVFGKESLVSHFEALRKTLLKCIVATALCYPVGYWITPDVINQLIQWSFPENIGKLHYFSPLEAFWVKLRLGFILAMIFAYPYNIFQFWKFLLPALYDNERKSLGKWITLSSILFFSGIAFCTVCVLPLLMDFAGSFSSPELQAMFGLENFLSLAGMMMLAFGIMFQTPILVFIAIRFDFVSRETLSRKRPYIMTGILIIAALLTPPDVISQILMAIPTWLLFELGLILSGNIDVKTGGRIPETDR